MDIFERTCCKDFKFAELLLKIHCCWYLPATKIFRPVFQQIDFQLLFLDYIHHLLFLRRNSFILSRNRALVHHRKYMVLVAFELIGTLACAVAFVCLLKVTGLNVACTGACLPVLWRLCTRNVTRLCVARAGQLHRY